MTLSSEESIFHRTSSLLIQCFSNMSTNHIQILFCITSGLCCFIPLIVGTKTDYVQSILRISVPSRSNRDSAVAAIALAFPIFIEIATEIFASIATGDRTEKIKMHVKQELLNRGERFVLACGLLTITATAFLPPDTPNLVNIYLCCGKCRFMLVGGAVSISLCRFDKNYWTARRTYVQLLLLAVGVITGAYSENFYGFYLQGIADNASYALCTVSLAISLYCNFSWLYSTTPEILKRLNLISSTNDEGMKKNNNPLSTSSLLFPLLYVATSTIVTTAALAINRVYPQIKSPDGLFYNHLGLIGYLLFLMYISERMMKYDVVEGLYALIESKRTYVRYISHELRTPLNSAFLGLKLVCDVLSTSTNPVDSELCETLFDVKSSCQIAVEILNDLLCFDKLESGILLLHKHEVPVIPFIAECVNMFASQAREAAVVISQTVDHLSPTALLDTDTAFMDKFKMDQVLRNLISNALKFTPRGGSVTVCASFIPHCPPCDRPPSAKYKAALRSIGPLSLGKRALRWLSLHNPFQAIPMALSWKGSVNDDIESGLRSASTPQSPVCRWNNCRQSVDAIKGLDISRSDLDLTKAIQHSAGTSIGGAEAIYGKLRIVVSDTGAGISEANQFRLFKEVVQFNPEVLQAGGGSGLGLWITSSIVQMHSGTISVYSAGAGRGSTFTVEIDMQRRVCSGAHPATDGTKSLDRTDSAREGETPAGESSEGSPSSAPLDVGKVLQYLETRVDDRVFDTPILREPRLSVLVTGTPPIMEGISFNSHSTVASDPADMYDVLVVDDSSLNRKLLCKLFRTSGYTCDEAEDGVLAVEKVRGRMAQGAGLKSSYDAILMDFVMPNMDGPTATQAIRGLGYTGPIFGVTGNALDSDVNHFISSGVNAVLAKPFDFILFKQTMKAMRDDKV